VRVKCDPWPPLLDRQNPAGLDEFETKLKEWIGRK